MTKQTKRNVIFVGGKTGGPVMPLLAVAKLWSEQDPTINPIFLDLKQSVSTHLVPKYGFEFKTVTSGKIRRYWSIKNFFAPFVTLYGLIQSLILLTTLKPIVVVGAGGYIQVPVIIAAWMLRIPRVIHQQDIIPTVSNKISAPFANKITTTFEKSVKDFPQGLGFEKNYSQYNKVQWTGNPTELKTALHKAEQKNAALNVFKLEHDWPTVLVFGGGSGARGLNEAVAHNLPELLKAAQVIHSTGVGKRIRPSVDIAHGHDRYHQFEFIDQMDKAYAAADVVIGRAGIGTITALSALGKVSIIVPMPDSHQETNAQYLYDRNAAIILDQSDIAEDTLAKAVRKVLFDQELQQEIQGNIRTIMPANATEKVLAIIKTLIHE
ncbi:MAG TPA: UDP-N-acetylglucosamine--N-acetylmuramyl-(pentapeptide) pyrophosphoryl-undecaprenol N-acetylglucosamine transferase [Patescibacteria group bacterium]|jgi:UDP-N-acetylglucosamine--N-acetylmuramyl-(pentapeptide) pyrophosphoryl-undecaprenol N-acetylglucosamine transferase|nr:UDP-N-acetylglucosamine--N-acetylmuramyl-(pentapeptide) pyrophosphoryl-undecaprenol N-acetylglucosamine transferase [Patescibacteria group bacterium]